ncbi:hypothetical protein EMPS_03274 [Entomortierella parvispora]|uniref:F-box domain-containing protein n=1 Tax=Entomortierella parvispora TaxID=205924 RepID=A0A9P3H6G9_9FUNG|nr:hypothetical protein EMPS_03274 [Entomortierella parvispora]
MSSRVQQNRSLHLQRAVRTPALVSGRSNRSSIDHGSPTMHDVPSRLSPLEINEILSSILSYQDQNTLKTVVSRVCRQWRSVAARHILHALSLHSDNQKFLKDLPSLLLNFNALMIGRKIRPLARPLSAEGIAQWNEMMDQVVLALGQVQPKTTDEHLLSIALDSPLSHDVEGKPGHPLIRVLTLSLETPNKLDPLLSMMVPSNLQELILDLEFSMNAFHLGTVLDLCSGLLHLTLSSHKAVRAMSFGLSKSGAWLHPASDKESRRPHPLRSLHILSMCVSPSSLQSYLPRLGNLIEFHCHGPRSGQNDAAEDSFDYAVTGWTFWETLARNCPLLGSLHFVLDRVGGHVVPVGLFPRVHDYGVDYYQHTVVSLLEGILENGIENRLTSLEIVECKVGSYIRSGRSVVCDIPDSILHNFLCSAPLLVNLKTGPQPMWSTVLWGKDGRGGTWACRRLKTLSLSLESDLLQYRGDKAEARHVFAYISRFCPELEDLHIEAGCPGLSLKSGLCLLTRLRNLRSLTLKGDFLSDDPPSRRELAWIQTPTSPGIFRTSRVSSWLPSFLHASSEGMNAPSVLEEAYLYCINMVQSLESSADTKTRLRMLQQQKDNQFSSDYTDQAFPMVDGLVDMEFSGSYLDIEARLHAQLYQLRQLQHLQALSNSGPQDEVSIKELKEAASAAEVWPRLKKIRLIHEYPMSNRVVTSLREPWHHVEKGSQILHVLRPDITVARQH